MDKAGLKSTDIVPNLQNFYERTVKESQSDIYHQRIMLAARISNLTPEEFKNIHLQDWYVDYWRITERCLSAPKLSEQDKQIIQNALNISKIETDPIKRQYLSLILLPFGVLRESQQLMDQKLWSPKLKADFDTLVKWNQLTTIKPDLVSQAMIRRNNIIQNILRDKYSDLIKQYSQPIVNNKTCPKVEPKDYQIYFCWLQGKDNLPPLIQCCYNSFEMNTSPYKICFIDEQNFSNYVELPNHIMDKFKAGKISRTHLSDIIRINLLEQYGGLWLDSTILITEPLSKYKNYWKMPFFTQKFCHERDNNNRYARTFRCYVSYARWAGFIQGSAILHNPLYTFMKEFYNEYWRDFDDVIDYVLMDFMMDIAYDNIPFVHKEMDDVPINNVNTWTTNMHLNDLYEKFPFDKVIKDTFLNKLSWKKKINLDVEGTVYKEILKRYGNKNA